MENKVILALEEKQVLEMLLDNAELRKQRIFFNRFWGNPVWCVASKANGGPKLALHPKSFHLWTDPRLEKLSCKKRQLVKISHHKDASPFTVRCSHGLLTYCIPLQVSNKRAGVLCMMHLRPAQLSRAPLDLLNSIVRVQIANASREYELKRLSESVRPRAIALSTVHTVHRIINSTLNLEELVNRLAHLTAQVLRARSCSIFLAGEGKGRSSKIKMLVEKARAGALLPSKHKRSLRIGEGVEGKVFATAKHVVRKNFICVPLIDEEVIGVIMLHNKKEGGRFDTFDQEILTTLAEEAVIAIQNAKLYEEQKRVTLGAIQSLAAILGDRFAHTRKLTTDTLLKITLGMADHMALSEEDKQAVHYAAMLKDAGKIGLPDEIFKKPTKLTGDEYKLVRQHPVKGALIVQSFESLKPVAPVILYSHEHFDGSGYPKGLKGTDIPVGARILSVVNAFDALVAGRPYKTRATLKEAVEELKRHKGTQFDPKVVEAFEAVIAQPNIAKLLAGM